MNLSIRAKEYISTLKRDLTWVTEIEYTKEYLQRNNIEPKTGVLDFQTYYSGYDFVLKNKPSDTFSATLFSQNQVIDNTPLDADKVDDKYIFICGNHKTAQFSFFLTDNGEFCTINDDDSLNILNSSFDKFIEVRWSNLPAQLSP